MHPDKGVSIAGHGLQFLPDILPSIPPLAGFWIPQGSDTDREAVNKKEYIIKEQVHVGI
jgi:hypothetical protein